MRAVDRLFQEHDVRLKKIANVFAFKSRMTIEREEFYQEFAVRLLELHIRYKDKPAKEFTKILNFSLHNLACDMLRDRFRIYYREDTDASDIVDKDSVMATIIEPSFLYFYKQAAHKLIVDTKSVEIFDWLVDNPDVAERIRDEKNIVALRARRLAIGDIVTAVSEHFELVPNAARQHIRVIKNFLKQVWALEGGI